MRKLAVVLLALLLAAALMGCTASVASAPWLKHQALPTATVVTPAAQLPPAVATQAGNQATAIAAPSPTAVTCTVATGVADGTVNVRSGPGMQYPVVNVVLEGDVLLILEDDGSGWAFVSAPELFEGWFYVAEWCASNGTEGVAQ